MAILSIHPLPAGEPASDLFTLVVDGRPAPVQVCRVSAEPLNQVWPGYQRPLEQTELAAFAAFGATGPVAVEVTSNREVRSVEVRPAAKGIRPAVSGRRISFTVPGPGQYTVEIAGLHQPLHLFVDPPEQQVPAAAPDVLYFGPGVHRPGKIVLQSNQTVYLAGGAVVHGSIHATGASNIRILGRGIIDVSGYERDQAGGAIRLEDCTGVVIDGLILRDPDVWCCSLFGCSRVEISNLKLIGLWRYNADGIDLCNCQDVRLRDSFVRAYDDCVVLKGLRFDGRASYHERPVRGITVERCVLWNDWGRALEVGAETSAPEMTGVVFRDCDVIHVTEYAMDIQHGDRASVHGIRFEDIRVEGDPSYLRPQFQNTPGQRYRIDPADAYRPQLMCIVITPNFYSRDQASGVVRDIAFERISLTGGPLPSSFTGRDAAHDVAGIAISGLRIDGRPCTSPADAGLVLHPHVSGVTFA